MTRAALDSGRILLYSTYAEKERCKEIPGGRWNRRERAWEFDLSPHSVRNISEVFGVDVLDKSLRAILDTQSADVTLPEMNLTLWQHQQDTVRKAAGSTGYFLGFDMGCIAGDTLIPVNRCRRGFKIRADVLYRKINGLPIKGGRGWDKRFGTKVRSLCGDTFRLNDLMAIISKGVKPVVKITLADGKALTLTPDHEVATPTGYVAAGKLQPFDIVFTARQFYKSISFIVSVEPAGETDVYDLVCADPWRNFVANGIVVHNCGKSLTAITLCDLWQAQQILIGSPKSVVAVWPSELLKHSKRPWAALPLDTGTVAQRTKKAARGVELAKARGVPSATIINYEGMIRPEFKKWALQQKWDAIIWDECVLGDTLIDTPTGQRPIESLKVGDAVLGINHDTGGVEETAITHTFKRETEESNLMRIGALMLTKNHPVMTQDRGYIPAGRLLKSDSIYLLLTRKDKLIIPCTRGTLQNLDTVSNRKAVVYNIETGTGNYFANGILVHNCHHLKAPGGVQSRTAANIAKRGAHRLGLSGTPFPHSPLDIYGQARAIDATVFGTSFTRFRSKYAVMGGYGGYEVKGFQNQDDLRKRFYSFATVVKKSDVLDLPPTVMEDRSCVLSSEERKVYNDLSTQFFAWVKQGGAEVTISNALVKLLRLQQVASGYVKTDDGSTVRLGTSKLDMFAEWLEDIPTTEPVVVFCRFVEDIEQLTYRSRQAGRSTGALCGAMNQLKEFQDGKIDTLICQIQAGAEGVDLTRSAICAFFSVGFSLGRYEQALARTDRPGQTRSVTYIRFAARDTVDERCYGALASKKKIIETLLEEGQ